MISKNKSRVRQLGAETKTAGFGGVLPIENAQTKLVQACEKHNAVKADRIVKGLNRNNDDGTKPGFKTGFGFRDTGGFIGEHGFKTPEA